MQPCKRSTCLLDVCEMNPKNSSVPMTDTAIRDAFGSKQITDLFACRQRAHCQREATSISQLQYGGHVRATQFEGTDEM